ncbi:MAG: glycosyltransferase family 39 protein [Stappiaceae bacterium]
MRQSNSKSISMPIVESIGKEGLILAVVVVLYCAFVLMIDMGRTYIGYSETDFINFTIPEAERALSDQPLRSLYHPPFYVLVVSTFAAIFGKWLIAGLAISLTFGVVSLLVSFALLRKLAGWPAAWGSVLALLSSVVFMGESVRAASDLLFLALFLLCSWFAVLALTERSSKAWFGCGVMIGLALITRSNALPLLFLFFAPALLGSRKIREAATDTLAIAIGFALPLLALLFYAMLTGSNILPVNNHMNLAMTYYSTGTDRGSIDAAIAIGDRFTGVFELLLADPARIIKMYVYDLYHLLSTNILGLVEKPLLLLFLPGLFLLLANHFSRPMALFLFLIVTQVLLVNFKPFEPRYYLFLIPLIGASIGQMCWWLMTMNLASPVRRMFGVAITLVAFGGVSTAALKTYFYTVSQEAELVELMPQIGALVGEDSAIVARKPQVAHHAGAQGLYMPDFASLDELRDYLEDPTLDLPRHFDSFVNVTTQSDDIYLLYGGNKASRHPQYLTLSDPATAPHWLEPALVSRESGAWILYRYRPKTKPS